MCYSLVSSQRTTTSIHFLTFTTPEAPLFVVWYSEAKAALPLEEPGHSWCWRGLTDKCNYSHKAPMGEEDVTSLNG